MYCRAYKTATLTPIQHTVCGGGLECLGSEKRTERELSNPLIIICLPPLHPFGFENITTALNRKNGNLSSQSDI